MNDSTNICLSCGLCCDGTLIGFVQLCEEEIPELSKLIEEKEECSLMKVLRGAAQRPD